jgi:3-methyladenine DNA glycosylase AlkD
MLKGIKKELREKNNKEKAEVLQKFFKTKKGEYGEGDIFLGIAVPELRKIVKKNKDISIADVLVLLHSRIHEERFIALLIFIDKFSKESEKIFNLYLKNLRWINNWDLVDISAYRIIGEYLFDKEKTVLYNLARSNNLWERRIAIMSTFYFIRKNPFEDTINIAEILLHDKHDLIHKAVGWMLREVGKRDLKEEERFLMKNYKKMPRTMLRYAIEKFPENKRILYLKKD